MSPVSLSNNDLWPEHFSLLKADLVKAIPREMTVCPQRATSVSTVANEASVPVYSPLAKRQKSHTIHAVPVRYNKIS